MQTLLPGLAAAPRLLSALAAVVVVLGAMPILTRGADYPHRTVVVICPWAAGGGSDRVARFVADQLQRELHQPVVVQNQTGGSGAAGHAAGARARPDGYTLTLGTFELCTMRPMGISDLTYRDFQPLMQVNADPAAILVRHDAPWQSLRDLLDDIRRRPGQVRMSGTAAGGARDLARAGLLQTAGLPIDSVVWAPSQGAAPSLVELLGGHVDVVCCSIPEAQSQLDAQQLRVLSVLARERLPSRPQTPTAHDEGIAWEAVGWRGLFLPPGTPDDVQRLLSDKLTQIMGSAAYQDFAAKNGFGIAVRTGTEFTEFLAEQERRWLPVIEAAGYAAEGGQAKVVTSSDPGPWFMPLVLAAAVVCGTGLLAAKTLWQRIRLEAPSARRAATGSWRRFWKERGKTNVVLLLAGLAAYLVVLPPLGFFVATGLFAAALLLRLGVGPLPAAGSAAAMLLIVYVLFVWQFRVVLPTSPWWPF